jgi:hypothetical protein
VSTRRPTRTNRVLGAVVGVLLGAATLAVPTTATVQAAGPATGPTHSTRTGLYVVTLTGQPAAAHRSTRPAAGERFDRTDPAVVAYRARLRERQDRVIEAVGAPEVLYRYTTALNGFAAVLDGGQVKALRSRDDVLLVERSTTRRTASDDSRFLDLDRAGGAWQKVGGARDAGRGVVVGVVDSGLWPDNPSFAGLAQARPGQAKGVPGFHGACATAERWSPSDCNGRVVSARWFVRGFGVDRLASTEVLSPRDTTGHGSHAASVVAGARDVQVSVDGQRFGRDSGVAPAARVAVYKACWTAPDPADDGCATADTVAAIDRAVADGVDVLNYSVAGADDPGDSVSRAFLGATAAGVFVAAAAGNEGPDAGTVGNTAPWVTTVAASTSRLHQGAVRLPDGTAYVGAMTSRRSLPETRVVLAREAAAAGAPPDAAARCEEGRLDAAKVQGAVVVCERGVTARVDKSTAVSQAGGVGMVLANTQADSVDADVHAVPTVHLDAADAASVEAYIRDAGADARVTLDASASEDVPVPTVAGFSARGPVAGGDVLKPDLTAPGVAVVGATAPPGASGRLWDLMSGTSVSTAHVAGLAALVRAEHPSWSPARIRAAMTMTAFDVEGDADPFAQGAGHVDAARLLDPGLVVDAGPAAWRAFLRGDVRPQDLNVPSVALGSLLGRTTVVRRLTNVADTTETYTASISGLPGVSARVRPSVVTLGPGESRRVRIRLVASPDAPTADFSRGAITWTGLSHQARMPVVVRTAVASAPGEVGSDAASGTLPVTGRSGRGTPVEVTATGLVGANPIGLTLQPGPFDAATPEPDADTFATDVTVTDGAVAARFEVSARSSGDDFDVYVYRDGALVSAATSGAADAVVTVDDPEPGTYRVIVNAARAGNGSAATASLTSWVVGATGGTPLTVTPGSAPARPGGEFDYTLGWDGLDTTQQWLAVVRYAGSDRRTYLRIG